MTNSVGSVNPDSFARESAMQEDWIAPPTGARMAEAEALDRLAAVPAALLGESHDRAEDHLWQARVIDGLADRRAVVVGLEMVPRRSQPALDAWVAGALDEAAFLEAVRWREVWGFEAALYMPVFRLCRERGLPMRGLNLDRPLISIIGRDGWDAIPEAERGWLTPAVPALPAYRRYLFDITGGAHERRAAKTPEDAAFDRFVRAQQAWDRSFACAIAAALAERPGALVAALIGRGHLEYRFGTPMQLDALGVGSLVALPGGPPGSTPPIADLIHVADSAHPAGT